MKVATSENLAEAASSNRTPIVLPFEIVLNLTGLAHGDFSTAQSQEQFEFDRTPVKLIRDTANKYDKKAILVSLDGQQLGHIAASARWKKQDAHILFPWLEKGLMRFESGVLNSTGHVLAKGMACEECGAMLTTFPHRSLNH